VHSRRADLSGSARSELVVAAGSFRQAYLGVGLMSGLINLLMLTGSLFMLEIYDRVLPSRSVPTLLGLAVIAAVLYVFMGLLDFIRGRVLVRIGAALDCATGPRAFDAVLRLPLRARAGGDGLQPLRDLDQVRGFLTGGGLASFFDLPWMPLYLGICFLLHFWIGITALAGAVVLVALTFLSEALTRSPTREANAHVARRLVLAEAGRRNAEAIAAMGMAGRLAGRFAEVNARALAAQQSASDVGGGLGALSRLLRLMLQSAVLGVGAYLVIHQEATPGTIIAGSILAARALAPVEQVIAHWRGFVTARQGWVRLNELLSYLPVTGTPLQLPPPAQSLRLEAVAAVPPGDTRLVVQEVGFQLTAGSALAVIGPSASGKSSLARTIVGVWRPVRGTVRLDGAALDQWSPEALGEHIGYLPQDVELFDGSVAENIARFEGEPEPSKIIAAAQAACVHEMILRLPEGYETRSGEGGRALSAGQRQRIALARALYGAPFVVVLDEPNSNLDAEGEEALNRAILGVKQRGGIVILIAHRPSALAAVDQVLVMAEGRPQAFGPKDEVLKRVLRPTVWPLKVAAQN
jgi:ATP-binding cassette subfamily C protein